MGLFGNYRYHYSNALSAETTGTDTICPYMGIPTYGLNADDISDLHIWAWKGQGRVLMTPGISNSVVTICRTWHEVSSHCHCDVRTGHTMIEMCYGRKDRQTDRQTDRQDLHVFIVNNSLRPHLNICCLCLNRHLVLLVSAFFHSQHNPDFM